MACSWNLRGHSKSLNVPPVDRSCRTSYQSTNATIALFSIYLTLNNDMTLKYRLGGSLRSKSRSPNIILALFYFTGNTHGVTRSRHRLMNNRRRLKQAKQREVISTVIYASAETWWSHIGFCSHRRVCHWSALDTEYLFYNPVYTQPTQRSRWRNQTEWER